MKKIGIIFAMQEELVELKNILNITNEFKIFELTFYEGSINNINYILVESGVGKVNAARATQILIDNFDVDYIFNIGVAGGVDASLSVGDIVVGTQLVQHDFDITGFNHEKGYIPNVGVFMESDQYLVKIVNDVKNNLTGINIVNGVIASGDIFCTDMNMSQKINKKFNALCVDMEGAAISQVSYLNHVPFLVLRSISDAPNNNNVITYNEFLNSSCKKIALFMKKIIEQLDKVNY